MTMLDRCSATVTAPEMMASFVLLFVLVFRVPVRTWLLGTFGWSRH